MKHFFLLFVVACFMPFVVKSQLILPVDTATNLITYQELNDSPLQKDILFSEVNSWISKAFKGEFTITVNDSIEGKIEGRNIFSITNPSGSIKYSLQFNLANNSYYFKITDFKFIPADTTSEQNVESITDEATKSNIEYLIDQHINGLLKGLKSEMQGD